MNSNYVKVTLIKSPIGRLPKHKSTLLALGLKKINKFVILSCTKSIAGMIKKVNYLVKVEKCDNGNVFK